ncbi:MAG: beta-galactosidase [Lachnospiraceae bacterium]|nr:beta-galactosidase [Lachnospiraceae bacterium]
MKLGEGKVTYNNRYLMLDGEPWFPVMGEFHFSRYPKKYWKESLLKMKAGGMQLAATYVFWIHHEEIEGKWDFEGNKDLKLFVEACKEVGMPLVLRIGPWAHGECRNGGSPDWLLKKDFKPRTNDEAYFAYVRKFYEKIYEQVKGFLWKDNGPIMGIQIENEYGHCGGMRGEDGEEHMRRLTALAKEIGLDAEFYTATGWGGAVTGGLIPVMGGYCDAPWARSTGRLSPSGNYIFTNERNDGNIGSDFKLGDNITYDYTKFPYLTAELGGGLQVTHHRRPAAQGEDIGAMTLVKMGCGVNLLGYYMYHGGTNPEGKLTTLQETLASGGYNDLPELSYDFRAPIREYGQKHSSYGEIKLLTSFVKDFGTELCKMVPVFPEDNPIMPGNFTDIRYAYRHDGRRGYLFINNYQRLYEMSEHEDVEFEFKVEDEIVRFPKINLKNGDYAFYPFNFELSNAEVVCKNEPAPIIKTALATPFCKLNNDAYVFYAKGEPCYDIEGDLDKAGVKLLTISREDALNAYKISESYDGKEHVIIYEGYVLEDNDGIELIGTGDFKIKVYPEFVETPEGFEKLVNEGELSVYLRKKTMGEATIEVSEILRNEEKAVFSCRLDMSAVNTESEGCSDVFVNFDYEGDTADLFIEGKKVSDDFFTGFGGYTVGLKRFDFADHFELAVYPYHEGDKVYLERLPKMIDGVALSLEGAKVYTEEKARLLPKNAIYFST